MLIISACDKAEIQKPTVKVDDRIDLRTDDCTDCPVNDCCCEIVQTSGTGLLSICGSTGARLSSTPCGPISDPPSPCPAIAASYILGPFTISSAKRQGFCVPVN